jgi:hypothetical protein
MEKKQTPIDWLFEQIPFEYTSTRAAFEAKKIAEQMFEEQIEQAVTHGNRQEVYDATETLGKKYFEQTFKK